MKIPIHDLLAKLGLDELDVSDPKDLAELQAKLDEMIKEAEAEENATISQK